MKSWRVLVIGTGSIGERHARCFLATGRAEVSICETNEALRRAIANKYPLRGAHAHLDQALAACPEIAVVCTPAQLHVPMALRLADAGIHILLEKPVSTSLDNTALLQETVRRQHVTIGVGYVLRLHPVIAALHEQLHSGAYGEPVELVVFGGQHFPTYRPAYREIYYTRHETGGGAIQDALTHLINTGIWLLGPIDRLVADAAHLVLPDVEVEDTVHLLARHGKVLATYGLNQHQAPNETTITVVCQRGTLRGELHNHCWHVQTDPTRPRTTNTLAQEERDALFVRQANRFLDAVEGKDEISCTLADGIATLRVNLAALASVRTGTWQDVGTVS